MTDRLKRLAEFLDGLAPQGKKFALGTWTSRTSACAIGHAIEAGALPGMNWTMLLPKGALYPTYKDEARGTTHTDWAAVEKYFGVTPKAAIKMFAPESYDTIDVTPRDVAARIREVARL